MRRKSSRGRRRTSRLRHRNFLRRRKYKYLRKLGLTPKQARRMRDWSWARIRSIRKIREAKKPEIPKPAPPMRYMWRYTVAINYVVHHQYRAWVLQAWFVDPPDANTRQRLIEQCIAGLEEHLGYARTDWWWDWQIADGLQAVPYTPWLIGRVEMRDELLHTASRPRKIYVGTKYVAVRDSAEKQRISRIIQERLDAFIRGA